MTGRRYLFLQGVASPLFPRLARELERRGHMCRHLNICAGDRLFWPKAMTSDFRGRYDEWPGFLREFLDVNQITDLIFFADTRRHHRLAAIEARHRKIGVHIFEEGYLRPYWITLEEAGTNGYSTLPRTAAAYHTLAETLPERALGGSLSMSFFHRAAWDIVNNALNITFASRYPYYESHRPWHPLHELGGWSRRVIRRHVFGERSRHLRKLARFLDHGQPFFVFPLQLESDSQLTVHSDFETIGEVLEEVLASFSRHAPTDCYLVIKCHPLDNDLTPRGRQVSTLASRHHVTDRTIFVDGGHLPTLLDRARGVVTVNSTVGLTALKEGRPVKALGRAIYNFEGLASQQSLAEFWSSPRKPCLSTVEAFVRVLRARCVIRGSFYSEEGISLAVQEAADLLMQRASCTASSSPPSH